MRVVRVRRIGGQTPDGLPSAFCFLLHAKFDRRQTRQRRHAPEGGQNVQRAQIDQSDSVDMDCRRFGYDSNDGRRCGYAHAEEDGSDAAGEAEATRIDRGHAALPGDPVPGYPGMDPDPAKRRLPRNTNTPQLVNYPGSIEHYTLEQRLPSQSQPVQLSNVGQELHRRGSGRRGPGVEGAVRRAAHLSEAGRRWNRRCHPNTDEFAPAAVGGPAEARRAEVELRHRPAADQHVCRFA